MVITSDLVDAYLNCPSKCWFRFKNEVATRNMYSQWLEKQKQFYHKEALNRLITSFARVDCTVSPSQPINVKKAKWRLATDSLCVNATFQSRLNILRDIRKSKFTSKEFMSIFILK